MQTTVGLYNWPATSHRSQADYVKNTVGPPPHQMQMGDMGAYFTDVTTDKGRWRLSKMNVFRGIWYYNIKDLNNGKLIIIIRINYQLL